MTNDKSTWQGRRMRRMTRETGQELRGSSLRRREERRWQEERVSRLMSEMRDMEALHLF